MSRVKFIVLFTVFLDVVGMGIAIPILPIYLHDLTSSAFLATVFFSIYALFGFFSSPVLGGLSDRYGRRPILIGSLFGAVIGWGLFAWGGSLIWLILGRIIQGLASGNMSTAQSALSDLSVNKHDRMKNFGLMGMIFGIGFIIGPALGALLADAISITFPFWLTAILSLVNALLALFFFPETHEVRDKNHPVSIHPFSGIIKSLKNIEARRFVIAFFLIMMSFTLFQSVFSLYTHLEYGLSAAQNGWIMTLVGVVVAINQGFFLNKVWLKYFTEQQLQNIFLIALIVINISFAFNNWIIFLIALPFLPLCQSVLRVVTMNEITEATHENGRGEVIGVTQSLMFLASIISPIFGGWALEYHSSYPWLMGVIYLLAALFVVRRS